MREKLRTHNRKIKVVHPNQMFIFGSNLAGRHGAGAAKFAKRFGAVYGVGEGPQGNTYALPTKDNALGTLPLKVIKTYVDKLYSFVLKNQDVTFLLTDVGCGLAGYRPEEMAPLFTKFQDFSNVIFPDNFVEFFDESRINAD